MRKFTHNIQYAGYAFDVRDDEGELSYDEFLALFKGFPWGAQMTLREKMEDGCSATISVIDEESSSTLWVSVRGDDKMPTYILGSIFIELSAIDPSRSLEWKDLRLTDDSEIVAEAFKIFFRGDFSGLYEHTRKLESFDPSDDYDQPRLTMPN